EPERAGEEYPFVAGKAVDVRFGLEPKEQPIPKKLALERRDGADDARIGCRQEAAQRYEQQAGVQSRAPVVLREAVELRVEPIPDHLREKGSTSLAKALPRLVEIVLFRVSDGPIQGGPRRHLRGGERALRAPHLPDAAVRLPPHNGNVARDMDQCAHGI